MQSLMPPIDSSDNLFHNGNPLTGEKGTIVAADFLNNSQSAIRDAQAEIIAVLTAASVAPDKTKAGQLLSSLQKLFLTRKDPFSDIKADALIVSALTNLGFTATTGSYPGVINLFGKWKLQFGIVTASSTVNAAKAITFAETFSSAAPIILLTPNNASTTSTTAWYDSQTANGFNLRCSAVVSVTYLAIG